jgi:hypothetical protein
MWQLNPYAPMSEAEIELEIQKIRQDEKLTGIEKGEKLNTLYRNREHRFGSKEKKNTYEGRGGKL